MFLHQTRLNKMAKEAYKSELFIGNLADGLVLSSGKWLVWVDQFYVSNKLKGLVMELAGCLPRTNSVFKISRKDPRPEYLESDAAYISILKAFERIDTKLVETPLIVNENLKLLQHGKDFSILGVPLNWYQAVDKYSIDYSIEGEPTGPCCSGTLNPEVYWYNSICKYMVIPTQLSTVKVHPELIETLETINFDTKNKS